jgi:hypothetical protein
VREIDRVAGGELPHFEAEVCEGLSFLEDGGWMVDHEQIRGAGSVHPSFQIGRHDDRSLFVYADAIDALSGKRSREKNNKTAETIALMKMRVRDRGTQRRPSKEIG